MEGSKFFVERAVVVYVPFSIQPCEGGIPRSTQRNDDVLDIAFTQLCKVRCDSSIGNLERRRKVSFLLHWV
jgi:hypothetical protein